MRMNDLLGGDFHHRSVLPALTSLTPSVVQYMKAVSAYGGGASQLMPVDEQKIHAFAATTFGAQFLAIDAVAPDGSVSGEVYERLREVFAAMKPYESFLGGVPVADVGVYLSQQSAVDFRHNGRKLAEVQVDMQPVSPHSAAVEGAVRALQDAHLPVTVVTRGDLDRLGSLPVLVLPEVARMDEDEIRAIGAYVERGGRLYASGYTSLVTSDGTRHPDYLLADLFGCHFIGEETALPVYLKPAVPAARASIAPVSYVAHGESDVNQPGFGAGLTALRVRPEPDADVIATTTLPYGTGDGTRDDQGWASIHNSPPWHDTDHPAVLRRSHGRGEVVYSVAAVETANGSPTSVARDFFVGIVRDLVGADVAFGADSHPDLWMTVFDVPEQNRLRLCFLNFPQNLPAAPIARVEFRVAPRPASAFSELRRAATGEPVPFSLDPDGSLRAVVHDLEHFEMLMAVYR
jgi:hypothetical protein